MGTTTKIEWCDHTFNPWRGCTHATSEAGVHPACEHCYAEAMSKRNPTVLGKWGHAGEGGTRVVASEAQWALPAKWNREAEKAGERRRVFCASLADVFEDWSGPILRHDVCTMWVCRRCDEFWIDGARPEVQNRGPSCLACAHETDPLTLDDVRRRLFELIDATPWLAWLLLTKRPENVRRMWIPRGVPSGQPSFPSDRYRANCWIGTSISDQATADAWIPKLLECRDLAPVLFLSIEPLLGPIDLHRIRDPANARLTFDALSSKAGIGLASNCRIDWVIVGGESGPHARPMHPQWARDIRDQCQAAGVPFFFKQWGEWVPSHPYVRAGDIIFRSDGVKCGEVVKTHPTRIGWPHPSPVFTPHLFREGGVHDADVRHNVEYDERLGSYSTMARVGKAKAGRLLDGREWSEFPEQQRDLFPV